MEVIETRFPILRHLWLILSRSPVVYTYAFPWFSIWSPAIRWMVVFYHKAVSLPYSSVEWAWLVPREGPWGSILLWHPRPLYSFLHGKVVDDAALGDDWVEAQHKDVEFHAAEDGADLKFRWRMTWTFLHFILTAPPYWHPVVFMLALHFIQILRCLTTPSSSLHVMIIPQLLSVP